MRDRSAAVALVLACVVVASLVAVYRGPSSGRSLAPSLDAAGPWSNTFAPTRKLQVLQLPVGHGDVDLAALPDRLANEASPSSLRAVVTVRGRPGVASAEGPAVVEWSESGVVYLLRSPYRTIEELIGIADALR